MQLTIFFFIFYLSLFLPLPLPFLSQNLIILLESRGHALGPTCMAWHGMAFSGWPGELVSCEPTSTQSSPYYMYKILGVEGHSTMYSITQNCYSVIYYSYIIYKLLYSIEI